MADKPSMADSVVAAAPPSAPPAPPKPRAYRCPNASYTITEGMCQARQGIQFHLCPRCKDRAPLPQAASPASSVGAPPNPN